MYSPKLFPDLTSPPLGFEYAGVLVEPLSVTHVVVDFEAVYVSKHTLHKKYGSLSNWPLSITLHDNLVDLGWHEKEFRDRTSFAYTITNQSRSICYGCIYIIPAAEGPTLTFWLRSDGLSPVDEASFETVIRNWLNTAWGDNKIRIA